MSCPHCLRYLGWRRGEGVAWSGIPPSREAEHLLTKNESREFMERFDAVDDRFDGVDKRLDAMEAKFEAMDTRFDAMDTRFDAMDTRFDAMDTRFDAMDTRFDAMDARFDAMDARFDAADERADAFDEGLRRVEIVGEDTRHLLEVVAEGVAGVSRSLEAFRLEVAAGFREQRKLVQALFGDLDRRVTRLEEGLSS